MITEYDISPWTEKYPDLWVRLIEYFPLSTRSNVLRMARYTLVQKRYLDLTKNRPALLLEVSGNFYNDERKFTIRRGGNELVTRDDQETADACFRIMCKMEDKFGVNP